MSAKCMIVEKCGARHGQLANAVNESGGSFNVRCAGRERAAAEIGADMDGVSSKRKLRG
jgi:hypothetical protein